MHSHLGLCRRGDNRLGKLLVFPHSVGNFHAANLTHPVLISAPCAATKITAYNHFDRETFTLYADSNHRIRCSQFPIRADIFRFIQKFRSNLIQNLTFVRNAFGQYDIKCRDAIGYDHDECFVMNVIYIANFTVIHAFLSGKLKFCFD